MQAGNKTNRGNRETSMRAEEGKPEAYAWERSADDMGHAGHVEHSGSASVRRQAVTAQSVQCWPATRGQGRGVLVW